MALAICNKDINHNNAIDKHIIQSIRPCDFIALQESNGPRNDIHKDL